MGWLLLFAVLVVGWWLIAGLAETRLVQRAAAALTALVVQPVRARGSRLRVFVAAVWYWVRPGVEVSDARTFRGGR